MAEKLQTPCAAPKRGIPWEFKYKYAFGAWISGLKSFIFTIREEYGAAAAIKLVKRCGKGKIEKRKWQIQF